MQEHDRAEFVTVIAAMAATFRQEASEAVFEGYWLGLSDLTLAAAKHAVTRAIRDCTFMPAAAELRTMAGILSPADRAIKAWDALQRGLRKHAYYHSVDFDDVVINATVRSMGGWMKLEERFDEDDEKWIRKDFERIYESFCRGGISTEAAAPLIGYFDQANHGRYPEAIKPPRRIETGLPPHRPGIVPSLTDDREPQVTALIEEATKTIGQPLTE